MKLNALILATKLTDALTDYKIDPACGPDHAWIILLHKSGDGRSLHIDFDERKEQFTIHGCWPFSEYHGFRNQFRPDNGHPAHAYINVSWNKDHATILADVQRRLLRHYDQEYPAQIARRDRYDNRLRAREETMKEFGRLLDCRVTDAHSGSNPRIAEEVSVGRYGIDKFRANHDGTEVQLTLRDLPVDLVRAIVISLKCATIHDRQG